MLTKSVTKRADVVDNASFEQSFSQLARKQMQNRSNLAAEREVGFQLLDKNDEGDWACGVFGVRTGTAISYVPCFFIDGEVKVEHLFVPDRDQFCPLSDKWVSAVEKFGQNPLGRSISRGETLKNPSYVDLVPFAFPRYKSAVSHDDRIDFKAAAVRLLGYTKAGVLRPGRVPSLPELVKAAGLPGVRAFLKAAQTIPTFDVLVRKVYPTLHDELLGLLKRAKENPPAATTKTAAVRPADPTMGRGKDLLARMPWIQKKAFVDQTEARSIAHKLIDERLGLYSPDGKGFLGHLDSLPVVLDARGYRDMKQSRLLGEAQLAKMAAEVGEKGYTVADQRKSTSFVVEEKIQLVSPTESGVYDVMQDDNTFKEMVVLMPIVTEGRVGSGRCMVLPTKNPTGDDAPWTGQVKEVIVKDQESADDDPKKRFDAWFSKKSKTPRRLEAYANYLFIDPRGHCTDLLQVSDGPTRSGHYCVRPSREADANAEKREIGEGSLMARTYGPWYDRQDVDDHVLEMTGEAGRGIRVEDHEIQIPTTAVALQFDGQSAQLRSKGLGNKRDLENLIFGKSAALEVVKASGGWSVNDRPVGDDLATITHLMVGWDLSHPDATAIVKKAHRTRTTYRVVPCIDLVKAAIAPAFPDERQGVEEGYKTAVPAQYPTNATSSNMSNHAQRTDYDGSEGMTPSGSGNWTGDTKSLGMSAEAGPGVFDTSAFSAMLRNTNEKRLVDEGLPALFRGMHQLGCYLFAVYAHPDQLKERYGEKDLDTFEDTLRTNFEQTGDVILFLKQTDANPFPEGSPNELES